MLRRGDLPAYSDPVQGPLWVHRAIGSVNGKANGGLGCVFESWWMENVLEDEDIPVTLSVHKGRLRSGRGRFCTLGISPKPAGSWKTNIPLSAKGRAIRAASLQLRDDRMVIAHGDQIFWDSSSS